MDKSHNQRRILRIVPNKGAAALHFAFPLIFLIFLNFISGSVRVNGVEAHGAEGADALLMFRLIGDPILLAMLFWSGRRLLATSPLNHIEVSAEGVTVRGIIGTSFRSWADIEWFSLITFPLSRPPIAWIRIRTRDGHGASVWFLAGGFARVKFFGWRNPELGDLVEWLNNTKAAFHQNVLANIPAPPLSLEGQTIEMLRPN
jgi:hypothetical protein